VDATINSPAVEMPKTGTANRKNQIIFLVAAVIILNAVLSHSMANTPSLIKVGDKLPAFSMDVLGGGQVSNADFLDKPTVLFFYAGWCPCSHFSSQWIKKAESEFGGEGLALAAVGIQDSSGKLKEFAEQYNFDFPVAVEGGNDVARSMGVKTTPTTLFVNKEGVVKYIFVGKLKKYSDMTEGLETILPAGNNSA